MKASVKAISTSGGPASRELKPLQRPSWLPERVWPFETSCLDANGMRLAVTDVGDGPALLFVHTGFWSFVWRDVMMRLAPDFRCIALDSPGTGRNNRQTISETSLERASRAVTATIEALDLSELTLVFHDLGGPVAIAGAMSVSERIRGLVAVNTFGWKPSGAMFRGMLALMGSAPIREFDALTGILARVTASNFGVGRYFDQESRAAFLAGIGSGGLRTFHQYLRDAGTAEAIYEQTASALAGPFKSLPLLTIFGERNDPLGFQPRWKQLFPAAHQVVVAKGNHFPMCDDPDLVADTIRLWHRANVAEE